jgi:hypothetical protein
VTVRPLLRGLAIYGLALLGANLALLAWLSGDAGPVAPEVSEIVSAWREGALVARKVGGSEPRAALASELTMPGTTLVLERVIRESRVLTVARRLFGLSLVSGRDGVRATLDGQDAYLTPDDLLRARLYRRTVGVDPEGVLERLARALGCSPEQLWKRGRFRRFAVARTVLASSVTGAESAPARQEAAVTGPRLMAAAREAARYLARRLLDDGRLADDDAAADPIHLPIHLAAGPASTGYDWTAHGAAALFLAESGARLDDQDLRSAARRAGWYLQRRATLRCGDAACVGAGDRVDTAASALALLAYHQLSLERVGATFRGSIGDLSAFLRAQQRSNGGFFASYDRARRRPGDEERPDTDAAAVLALARAQRITKSPADLDAARRGLHHLIARPGLLGVRDYLDADHRICEAMDELWDRAPDAAALDFCLQWTSWGTLVQLDRRGPVAELAGGLRNSLGWMPDLLFTAARTEGAIATLATAVRAGRKAESLRALDVRMASGLDLLLREQLPGARGYLSRDPAAGDGGFTRSPVDPEARVDATAAAGSAVLRCLEVIDPRGRPSRRKAKPKDQDGLPMLGAPDPTGPVQPAPAPPSSPSPSLPPLSPSPPSSPPTPSPSPARQP